MSSERGNWPEWFMRERAADMAWIQDNGESLRTVAEAQYQQHGRGALTVDVSVPPKPEGYSFYYFTAEYLDHFNELPAKALVEKYDPEQEFVVLLVKAEGRTSAYRMRTATTLR